MNTTKKTIHVKKIMKFIGYVLTAASLVFISWTGYIHWKDIKELLNLTEQWLPVLLSSLFYLVLISFIFSAVWQKLVSAFGSNIKFKNSFKIVGRTLIAKYIPGNVFHYIGRYLYSRNINIPNGIILNSVFTEIILEIISAVIVFFIFSVFFGIKNFSFGDINKILLYISIGLLFILIIIALAFILVKLSPKIKGMLIRHNLIINMKSLDPRKLWTNIFISLVLFLVFFVLTGFILWYLDYSLWDSPYNAVLFFIGSYSIAWLAGFITLGAPGGIGIREAVLIALISQYTGQANAFFLAIILRLITIFGDLLFFLSTFLFSIPEHIHSKND